jgi:peptidoglycan/LPS O-acetylase OafA/YrhL
MVMKKPRYFLMLAIFVLALGCFLLVGGSAIKQTEWPMYLGMTCLLVAICVAALIEALQAQHQRIEELERKLAEKQSPAAPNAIAEGGRVSGS